MKKILLLPLVGALSIFSACNQKSDADRQAEIDRQVQQRLDAEHQAQQREDLARREGELTAREQALAPTPETPNQSRESREDRPGRADSRAPSGDYGLFYSKLQPHGDWIETSQYGYVFHPGAAQSASWRPYTNGHWVYSDAGWTWVSDEPFGWAAYHYGRWIRLRSVGWVWIPGDEWAPAWVSWRSSDHYVGWAPLPPEARFERGTGIHNWADSYYDIGPENYAFVETREFGSQRVERAVVPAQQNVTIVNQTTNVTNITYNNTTIVNQGPSFDMIRARSAQPVQRVKLQREVNISINVGDPRSVVRGDALVIAAPVIQQTRVIEKPKVVKRTITNVVVERGWDDVKDRPAAERARQKIRSEATPPPNAPSRTFVKPQSVPASAAAPAERSTSSVSPSPEQSPSAAETSATPFQAPSPSATATASITPAPVESATPPRPRIMPNRKLPPDASPSASASAVPETTLPPNSLGESPAASPTETVPRPKSLREHRQNLAPNKEARREKRSRANQSPAAANDEAAASPSPSEPPLSARSAQPQDRPKRNREHAEKAEEPTTPSPSPSASATDTPSEM